MLLRLISKAQTGLMPEWIAQLHLICCSTATATWDQICLSPNSADILVFNQLCSRNSRRMRFKKLLSAGLSLVSDFLSVQVCSAFVTLSLYLLNVMQNVLNCSRMASKVTGVHNVTSIVSRETISSTLYKSIHQSFPRGHRKSTWLNVCSSRFHIIVLRPAIPDIRL